MIMAGSDQNFISVMVASSSGTSVPVDASQPAIGFTYNLPSPIDLPGDWECVLNSAFYPVGDNTKSIVVTADILKPSN